MPSTTDIDTILPAIELPSVEDEAVASTEPLAHPLSVELIIDDVPSDEDEAPIEDSEDDVPDDLDEDSASDEDESDDESPISPTFADLGLPDELLQAVTAMGFETPTPIQAEAIPALLAHRDVVGIAQTGTGKTAAFGLPMLADIDSSERDVQALVLAPTRELAMQSAQAMEDFAARSRNVEIVAVYGGSAYGPQLKALRQGAQIVVGTPGRLIDLIERGALDLSHVRMLVLDEADEMLRMGFAEDVEKIASSVPDKRLTALFSATMPRSIERVADTHLHDPLRIAVSEESSTVDTIHQTYAVVPFRHKIGALGRVLSTREGDAALVFVRTRADVEDVSLQLSAKGFKVAGISGDVAQQERERMVERLRSGTLDVLVATDVAARGLDVERIGLVVNFDVPREPESYVHRIGRTGRAGREGRSITFFTPRERGRLRRIEHLTGTPMEEVSIPTPVEVSKFRVRHLLDAVPARVERGRLDLYHTLIDEFHETSELDIADLAAALLAQAVGDAGPEPRADKQGGDARARREENVNDHGEFISASFEQGRDRDGNGRSGRSDFGRGGDSRRRSGSRPAGSGFGHRYRVEVGKKDGVRPGSIVGAITGEAGVNGKDLGRIDIYPSFSLVEIAGELEPSAMEKIAKARVQGRALKIHEDRGPASDRGGSRGGRGRSDDRREDGSDRGGYRRSSGDEGGSHGDRRHSGERHFGGSRGEQRPHKKY